MSNSKQPPAWVVKLGGVLLLVVFGWVGYLGKDYLDNRFGSMGSRIEGLSSRLEQVDKKTTAVETKLADFERQSEDQQAKLRRSIDTMKRTMPKQIQETIDTIFHDYQSRVDQRDKRLRGDMDQVTRSASSSQAEVVALKHEYDALVTDFWSLNAATLKKRLDEVGNKALEPIAIEWETASAVQSTGQLPTGFGFIQEGQKLTTKPALAVTLTPEAVVHLEGTVPSDKAKESIVAAFEAFRPRPRRIDASGLKVVP